MPYNYIISIKIDKKTLEQLDELVHKRYYFSRSEAVRDAIRRLIAIHKSFREQLRKAWGDEDD